jgi:hypothetical protein
MFKRSRTNEMIGVLKALCTLISALKKAPKDSGINIKHIIKT